MHFNLSTYKCFYSQVHKKKYNDNIVDQLRYLTSANLGLLYAEHACEKIEAIHEKVI